MQQECPPLAFVSSIPFWTGLVQILSSILQVWGTWLMANVLVTVTKGRLGYVLRSVFAPSSLRDEINTSFNLNTDNKIASLRGLALILIGFCLDLLCGVLELFTSGPLMVG